MPPLSDALLELLEIEGDETVRALVAEIRLLRSERDALAKQAEDVKARASAARSKGEQQRWKTRRG